MGNFGYLNATKTNPGNSTEYTIDAIAVNGKSPVFQVKPANESNKAYYNALLKKNAGGMRRMAKKKVTADSMRKNREEDRELYIEHVIVGWRDVVDEEGRSVEFSKEAVAEFLDAVGDWVFDDLRIFCADPTNFATAEFTVGEDEEQDAGNA